MFHEGEIMRLHVSLAALAVASMGSIQANAVEVVPGEVIVKLKEGIKGFAPDQIRAFGVQDAKKLNVKFGNYYKIKTGDQGLLNATIANFQSLPEVEYAEPNFVYRVIELNEIDALLNGDNAYNRTNDPKFDELWGLHNTGSNDPTGMTGGVAGADVDALRAWDITKGSKSVKIAVIDTGIDYNHPDLAENMWVNEAEANGEAGVDDDGNGFVDDIHGYDFANNDGDPMDGQSHGTHCAGTIAAVHDNGEGVAGVMSEATLVAIKFLTDAGSGTTADAIEAIDYATSLDVDIMSNSWGGGGRSQALADAISRAEEKGIYFVAAAGNSRANNDTRPHFPSSYENDNVIAVAAHNIKDGLASFSCYGAESVDIAAPGRNTMSTTPNGGYASKSGTSMATPHVSGVLGLLVAQEGRVPVAEMRERLLATSDPSPAYRRKMVSGGRVNAYNLLRDIRPDRPEEPDPSAWVEVALPSEFASTHPYSNNDSLEETFSFAGAKFVRVVVDRFDIENRYDNLYVQSADGNTVDTITGSGQGYKSDYVSGDTVTIKFSSDNSVTRWGFSITKVEVVWE